MEKYIALKKLAEFHHIKEAFLNELAEDGILEIHIVDSQPCAASGELAKYERAIRLYRDLGVNKEGIEIIMDMRDKMEMMQRELNRLRRELQKQKDFMSRSFYDDFFDID